MTGPRKRTQKEMARLRDLPRKYAGKRPRDWCLTVADVPTWAKHAIRHQILTGKRWNRVVAELGCSENALRSYTKSPGGRLYRDWLKQQVDDMDGDALGRLLASVDAGFWFEEGYLHYEACKKAGDLPEAGRMLRHMQEVAQLKKPVAAPVTAHVIQVTVQSAPEIPMGESEHVRVLPAEIIKE